MAGDISTYKSKSIAKEQTETTPKEKPVVIENIVEKSKPESSSSLENR